MACCLKLPERPITTSPMMSSSGTSLRPSCCVRPGDEGAVVVCVDSASGGGILGSRSMSLSRTCLTTSASRRNSASAGVLSSMRAARIRANPFVLGYTMLVNAVVNQSMATHKEVPSPRHHPPNNTALTFKSVITHGSCLIRVCTRDVQLIGLPADALASSPCGVARW